MGEGAGVVISQSAVVWPASTAKCYMLFSEEEPHCLFWFLFLFIYLLLFFFFDVR